MQPFKKVLNKDLIIRAGSFLPGIAIFGFKSLQAYLAFVFFSFLQRDKKKLLEVFVKTLPVLLALVVSLYGSYDFAHSLKSAIGFYSLFFIGFYLFVCEKFDTDKIAAFPIIYIFASILLFLDVQFFQLIMSFKGKALAHTYNMPAYVLVLFMPVALLIAKTIRVKLAVLGAIALVIFSTHANTAQLGFAVGIIAFAISSTMIIRISKYLFIFITLSLPFLFHKYIDNDAIDKIANAQVLPHSYFHRVLTYKSVVDVMHAHKDYNLLTGIGVSSSGAFTKSLPAKHYEAGIARIDAYNHFPHPHNFVFQWWFELGFIGTIFLSAFVWWVLGKLTVLPRLHQRFYFSTFICFFTFISTGKSAFHTGMWAILGISLLFIKSILSNQYSLDHDKRQKLCG